MCLIISILFPHVCTYRSRSILAKTIRFIHSSFSILLVKALIKGSFSKENKELLLIPEVIKGVAIYTEKKMIETICNV